MNFHPPQKQEMGFQNLSSTKGPDADEILAEVYNSRGLSIAEKLKVVSLLVEDGDYPTRWPLAMKVRQVRTGSGTG